jgi:hypothetical protein
MQLRTVLLLIVLAAIAAFAAVNWNAFATPTTLSVVVTTVQAPLGLIMLGFVTVLAFVFLVFVVYLQGSVLLDSRRHAKALQAQRDLADQAEASRFTELRGFIAGELINLAERINETRAMVLERVNQVEGDLRVTVEQSGNALAAYIGELEERLDQEIGAPRSNRPS